MKLKNSVSGEIIVIWGQISNMKKLVLRSPEVKNRGKWSDIDLY